MIKPKYVTDSQVEWLKGIRYDFKEVRGGYLKPEQWQVVEWLRVKHGVYIEVRANIFINNGKFFICIKQTVAPYYTIYAKDNEYFSSPQNAYSGALDWLKDNHKFNNNGNTCN
jgi:hypothetical protein